MHKGYVNVASVHAGQTGGDFSGTALSCIAAAATATTTCMAYDIGSIIEVNLNTSACSGRRVLQNYTVEGAEGHDGSDAVHTCKASSNFSGIITSCALQTEANITTTSASCDGRSI